jgi:hypothetical protein
MIRPHRAKASSTPIDLLISKAKCMEFMIGLKRTFSHIND